MDLPVDRKGAESDAVAGMLVLPFHESIQGVWGRVM